MLHFFVTLIQKIYLYNMRKILLVLILGGIWGTAFAQNLDREAFLDAEVRFMGGNYSLALERYDEFIRAWPNSPYAADARYRRAVSLYRLGRKDEAYEAFSAIEARYWSTKYRAYVPFWMGVIEYDRGEYPKALDHFNALAKKPPDQDTLVQSLVYLGKTYAALEQYETAEETFETYISTVKKMNIPLESDPSVLLFLSDMYDKLSEPEKMVSLWEEIDPAKLDTPVREQLTLRAAGAYLQTGEQVKGIALYEMLENSSRRDVSIAALQHLLEFEQQRGNETAVSTIVIKVENVLRSDPKALADFWLGLGSNAFHAGKYELARDYFIRVQAIRGDEGYSEDVPVFLAEIIFREGDTARAYQTLADAESRVKGDKTLLYIRMGWYSLLLENWPQARDSLNKAVSLADEAGKKDLADLARIYLAYGLYRSNQADPALSILGSLGDEPDREMRTLLSAELHKSLGQSEKALEEYSAILEISPSNVHARLGILLLYFDKAQYSQLITAAAEMEHRMDLRLLSEQEQFAFNYMQGIALAIQGSYRNAIPPLDRAISLAAFGGDQVSWAEFYRGWSFYRSSQFRDAADSLSGFVKKYPSHPQGYAAAYLAAWSYSRLGEYQNGAAMASQAASIARSGQPSPANAEAEARAWYLEGTLRPFFSDFRGALTALDKAGAVKAPGQQGTSYTIRAAFEKGTVYTLAGQITEADRAYEMVIRNFPNDPLAEEAAYRRGEIMYSAKRYSEAADRFNTYREKYPQGRFADGAVYFAGLSQKALGSTDRAILLWERLISDYKTSRYRFPGLLALAKAYREKQEWELVFNTYTTTLAEFGDRARLAGVDDEAETLRYIMAKLPEKAARLHVAMNKANGVRTAEGRSAALQLARYYITESAQREIGASLADDVIAFRRESPGQAAEAYLLKGDYYGALESWEPAAQAYLDAATAAGDSPQGAKTTGGQDIRSALAPEALFKAARARLRLGRRDSAVEITGTLQRLYPSSTWTNQARRLLEGGQ